MADLDELFGPGAWEPIQNQLQSGEDPEISDIAQALRGEQPVPVEVRLYIADLLEKKKKRKRGPKPDRSDRKRLCYLWVTSEVDHWIEVCKRAQRRGIPLQGGIHAVAREKVSKRTNIADSTVDKIYYARTKAKSAVS